MCRFRGPNEGLAGQRKGVIPSELSLIQPASHLHSKEQTRLQELPCLESEFSSHCGLFGSIKLWIGQPQEVLVGEV